MKQLTVSDVVKRPPIVTNATEVTLIEDAKGCLTTLRAEELREVAQKLKDHLSI